MQGTRLLLPMVVAVLASAPSAATTPAEIEELWRLGRYREAETGARSLVGEVEERSDAASEELAEAIDLLVEASWRAGRGALDEVLGSAHRTVAIKENRLPASDPGLAKSLLNLAIVHRVRAEYTAAEEPLARAVTILEESAPRGELLVAALHELGQLERRRGRDTAARAAWDRAIALIEERHGPDAPQLASCLLALGQLANDAGEYEEADELLERAVRASAELHGEDHPEYALALAARADVQRQLGDYEQARRAFERALAVLESRVGTPSQSLATLLSNLSVVLHFEADRVAAVETAERALEMQEQLTGPLHPLVSSTLNNLGGFLAGLGDLEGSLEYFRRALEVDEKRLEPGDPILGQDHANFARTLLALEDYDAARHHFGIALEILTAVYSGGHPQLATLIANVARLDAQEGRLTEALRGAEQAARMRESALGPDHPMLAVDLRLVSRLARATGDLETAAAAAARTLHIRETRLGPRHQDVASALVEVAGVELALGRRRPALAHAERAAEIVSDYLSEMLSALSERRALGQMQVLARAEEILFSGLLSAESDREAWLTACWEWTVRRRGRVLEEIAARHRAGVLGSSPQVREAWQELGTARLELAELMLASDVADATAYQSRLAVANRRKEAAETALSRVSARYREQARSLATTFEDVRGALPQGAALVEIVRAVVFDAKAKSYDPRPHDVALVLDAGRRSAFVDLGTFEETDRLVADWRRALAEGQEGTDPDGVPAAADRIRVAGEALRRRLWDDVAPLLGEARRVFWVLDGDLHQVPMAALPAPDGGYLVETLPAHHVLGAARDLVLAQRARDSSERGRGILAMGAADFDAGAFLRLANLQTDALNDAYRGDLAPCPSVAGVSWQPLPQTYLEVQRIGALFEDREPVLVLYGPEASEERLKLEAPGKRVLHLATHGFFVPSSCHEAARSSPLLNSGLVLAGANRHEGNAVDDGFLTAEELAALDLGGVDLVVLSACDTGRGDVQVGEGVFGLRRALHIAGARSVVMSLWPVPDTSARRWMGAFYGALESGSSLLDASREASLVLLERLRRDGASTHPHLWAGFVAAGDWR